MIEVDSSFLPAFLRFWTRWEALFHAELLSSLRIFGYLPILHARLSVTRPGRYTDWGVAVAWEVPGIRLTLDRVSTTWPAAQDLIAGPPSFETLAKLHRHPISLADPTTCLQGFLVRPMAGVLYIEAGENSSRANHSATNVCWIVWLVP